MRRMLLLSLLTSIVSYATAQKTENSSVPEPDLNFNSKDINLSKESESYIDTVVSLMRKKAIHKKELDFDKIQQVIRYYANGASTVEDTHEAIKKALPLLKDHHSYFMTSAEINQFLGFSEEDMEEIKKGKAPHIADSKIDSLKRSLEYTSGEILDGDIGYLAVPSFDNLYDEGMTMFADSLQELIRKFDKQHVRGWIMDLRDNNGGAAMPMVTGLGPLLDEKNAYYTVDEEGQVMSKTYYKNGGYYDVSTGEKEEEPLVHSTIGYKLNDSRLPIAVLTSFKTASSAEAVTAIFSSQPNVKIIGSKTNGLTSTNSFNFLEDNSALNLTIGYYANREHYMYRQGIAPDIEVQGDTKPNENLKNDIVVRRAIDWIKE